MPSENRRSLPLCNYDSRHLKHVSDQDFPRMTASEFLKEHSDQRFCWPVIILGALDEWPALRKWNRTFFSRKYANERATAVGVINGERDGFALPIRIFASHTHDSSPEHWTYLHDEYFIPTHPELRSDLLPVPEALSVDYFQALPEGLAPENAFLLWGTKYSKSELHIDPYNWTGSNALLVGRKKWKLYPPGQDRFMYAREGAQCGSPLNCFKYQSAVDAFAYDSKQSKADSEYLHRKYPLFKHAISWEATQTPGELMLIPSSWYHQVANDVESIAVASQAWTDDGFEITMEEIAKYPGNAPGIMELVGQDGLSRQAKLKALLRSIPDRIIQNARTQISDIHRRIQTSSKKVA